jgi:hypothetical protein
VNIYCDLTRRFNVGRVRAILAGGQAVVLHRLAMMSKDGDWILREDEETADHVLATLAACGASYRFGAPLDVRWLRAGWSSHLEYATDGLRVRTDFVTRPPRLDSGRLDRLWANVNSQEVPFVDAHQLVDLKKTNREKDYAVIGELARRLNRPEEQLLCSRSARDLIALAERHPGLAAALQSQRPILHAVTDGQDALEAALDAERRVLMRANEQRLSRYMDAAAKWAARWPDVARMIQKLPLREAHEIVIREAAGVLPTQVPGGWP